jgi:hypothetical protein
MTFVRKSSPATNQRALMLRRPAGQGVDQTRGFRSAVVESTRSTLEVFLYQMQASQSPSGFRALVLTVYLDVNPASLPDQKLASGAQIWLKSHREGTRHTCDTRETETVLSYSSPWRDVPADATKGRAWHRYVLRGPRQGTC